MTESESQANSTADNENQQQFAMQKIYVKDLSFETPNSPSVFTQEWKPDVNVELDTKGKEIAEDVHEVVLGVTVTVKLGETIAYLAEVHQAGIFTIKGVRCLAVIVPMYCFPLPEKLCRTW